MAGVASKSKKRRIIFRKSAKKTVKVKLQRKPKRAHCGNCGSTLYSTASILPKKIKNLPKSRKRPERPYGGVLCPACTRAKIKDVAKNV